MTAEGQNKFALTAGAASLDEFAATCWVGFEDFAIHLRAGSPNGSYRRLSAAPMLEMSRPTRPTALAGTRLYGNSLASRHELVAPRNARSEIGN
ncbi:MAG: hypothetical protein Q8O33_01095 [Pseudomonadota bacterium]|nr:hypothetical protein [Pseudomonadota bacterium]